MKISVSSCLAFLLFPALILSAIIPFLGGSLFDFTVLPVVVLYSILRFPQVILKLPFRLPIICYSGILLFVFFLRFAFASSSDFLIAGTGLRLLMPVSFLVVFVDLYHYIFNLNDRRKGMIVNALIASYLLAMIVIMIVSFQNGIGALGLGLSFPLYTETQLDRHVYGPSVAALVIFCICSLFAIRKNDRMRQLFPLILIAAFLGFFSSIASGSRSSFAMYSFAIAYLLYVQILRSRVLSLLKAVSASLLVFLGAYLFQNFNSEFAGLINRSLGFFEAALDPATDHSRSVVYFNAIEQFSNPDNWLVGASYVVGAADSGFLNLLLNGGIPLIVSFVAIWFSVFYVLPYSGLKILLVSVLAQFALGSETLFIPRYLLVVSFPVFFLSLFSFKHLAFVKYGVQLSRPLPDYLKT